MADGRMTGDEGAALFELALLLPFLATFVFGVVDLGRAWQLKNRLAGAARAGAEVAQYTPGFVGRVCNGGRSVDGAARAEDPGLGAVQGFTVAVRNVTTGQVYAAGTCASGLGRSGDRVLVVVSADFTLLAPGIAAIVGSTTVPVTGSNEVVVQG